MLSTLAWSPPSHCCMLCTVLQAFFCGGCRYRVTAAPDWTVAKVTHAMACDARSSASMVLVPSDGIAGGLHVPKAISWAQQACAQQACAGVPGLQVKQALWAGGIQRSNKPEGKRHTPGLQKWEDLVSACWLLACQGLKLHHLLTATTNLWLKVQ